MSASCTAPSAPLPEPVPRGDDFHFGEHGDQTYYISHTVKRGARSVVLRLGFDESPTLERILAAKRHVLTAILAFALVSMLVAVWLSAVIARPMVRLQEAARRIAGGDVRTHLEMQQLDPRGARPESSAGAHAPGAGRHQRAAAERDPRARGFRGEAPRAGATPAAPRAHRDHRHAGRRCGARVQQHHDADPAVFAGGAR